MDNFTAVSARLIAAVSPGDFSLTTRRDGIRKWAYHNKPLYTFTGDVAQGDVNGKDIDPRYHLVMLTRYFMPDGVSIRSDQLHGGLLVDARGMTLYARDTLRYPASGAHHARGGATGIPSEGMAIGLDLCAESDENCRKNFQPLIAPREALASGYWSVLDRPDGRKKWAYMGYALFTFNGDRQPGDTVAYDTFDLMVNTSLTEAAPKKYRAGLYWRIVSP